jgi:ribosomal protein S18 acetylase RimI-like enzyme
MAPTESFSSDALVGRRMDEPPPRGFDCGREAQNRFLYDSAWSDQSERLSVTYLYYVSGLFAAYATALMNSVVLGSREKPKSISYKSIAALHLAQLGVDIRFQGWGLGSELLSDVTEFARQLSNSLGCRYVTLDAHPELVGWYEKHGFVINKLVQKQRIEAAAGKRPLDLLPVSMRFDLLAVPPHEETPDLAAVHPPK